MIADRKKYTSKKFLETFAISAIVILLGIGFIGYIIDPFFQFRVNTNSRYILNPRLVNGGLAKNYNYNTVLLGSSMVQNYNMSILRENHLDMRPVKLSSGGMNIPEMEYLYSFVNKDSTKEFIINVDIALFNQFGIGNRYPKYLYDDGILNKLKYLYGYETWMQYIPADIGMTLYFKIKKDIPLTYRMKTNIDDIGNNSFDVLYNADNVKAQYLNGISVSPQVMEDMKLRMEETLDSLLTHMEINKHKGVRYTFVFSSYSALYWYHARRYNYYDPFMDFVYYFNKSVEKYDNTRIAFFFDREEITDLNYYSDITHFGPVLSDTILTNVYNPKYELNSQNIDSRMSAVDDLVNSFIEENKNWLPE